MLPILIKKQSHIKILKYTRWIAGLRPASLLGLRLPNKVGVFATHTMNHRKLAENKRSQTDMKIVDCSNKIASYLFKKVVIN